MRILIVEDEKPIADGLKFNFEQEGYEVELAGDGTTALEMFQKPERRFDLVVLDLMLPSMSGYETCEEIRKLDGNIPILVLSARTLSEDKAQAFDCGTDQYMTKPFALPELLSRVRNLLERRSAANGVSSTNGPAVLETYDFANVHIDFRKFEVTVGETTHSLTRMELDLLKYFVAHEGLVLSRSQILEDVWDESADVTSRSIDNFVMRLRRILEGNPAEPQHILSVRGTGYRFVAHPEPQSNDNERT